MDDRPLSILHYLPVSPRDEQWGIVCTTAGHQHVPPGTPYPVSEHPEHYLFYKGSGRTLDEYQLVYITAGRGRFESASCPSQTVEAGTMLLLFPNEWHSYSPDPGTGWTEWWVGFRGANIDNILDFQKKFPLTRLFKLERNYRSTRNIVSAASSLMKHNRRQIAKEVYSEEAEGDRILYHPCYSDKEEAMVVAKEIDRIKRQDGCEYDAFAILYRTNAQSRSFEDELRKRAIPYIIYGGLSFYQRKEIKDMLAYVRLVVNPRDDEALRRIINTPARGISDVTIGRIAGAAAANGLSMWEAVSTLDPAAIGLAGAAGNKVAQFAKMIGELSEMRSTTEAYTLGLEIATRSGLIGTYKMQQTPESISALENIEELLNSIRVYTEEQERMAADTATEGESAPQALVQIDEWLQNVALLTDMDNENPEERNKVTLMTVHSAKGLEFEYVYVAGLEENLFPSMMSMGTPEGLEEERRLFYVALTRAKRAAVLSFAESRFKWGEMTFGRPSRFLSEIDPQYLDLQFELGDSRDSDEEANSAPRYGRPGGPSRYGRPGTGPSQGYGQGGYGKRAGAPDTGAPRRTDPPAPGARFRSLNARGAAQSSPATGALASKFSAIGTERPAVRPTAPPAGYPPRPIGGATSASPHVTGATNGSDPPGASSSQGSGEMAVGTRVEHAKFGVGEIVAIEEWTSDVKLTVDFGAAGRKVLLKKFAKLQIL